MTETRCLCESDDDYCMERNSRGLYCTQPVGHSGDHVACGHTQHDLARWPNEADPHSSGILNILSDFEEIVAEVQNRPDLSSWDYYVCQNGTMDLDRLSFLLDTRYEVQVNLTRHAEVAHCHGCNMVSVMLLRGYGWHLRPYGCDRALPLFSGEGSVITMRVTDTHWIPKVRTSFFNVPPISLCVFDRQSDWAKQYPKPPAESEWEFASLLSKAQVQLRKYRREVLDEMSFLGEYMRGVADASQRPS